MIDQRSDNQLSRRSRPFPIPADELRRALRLLFPADAHQITTYGSSDLEQADFPYMVQRIRRGIAWARWRHRLAIWRPQQQPPFGPTAPISLDQTILLVFRSGLGIDLEDIADALSLDNAEAYANLAQAHQTVEMDRRQIRAMITSPNPRHRHAEVVPSRMVQWIPVVSVVLVAVVIAAALFGSRSVQPTESTAAPLIPHEQIYEHRGWLLLSTDREVFAIDLEHGERRRILQNPNHDWWNPWIVSPDGRLLARWEETSRLTERAGAIRAYDLTGTMRYLHRWEGNRTRVFNGWLNNREVLFQERGATHASDSEDTSPALIAIDLVTGDERTLYRGVFVKAIPSPTGEHIGILYPHETFAWPGRTLRIHTVEPEGLGDPVVRLDQRWLNWPGRAIWSANGERLYVSSIDADEAENGRKENSSIARSHTDFERIGITALGIDGTSTEYTFETPGWAVVQSIAPDESAISILVNPGDFNEPWAHGTIDRETGQTATIDTVNVHSLWFQSETVWIPGIDAPVMQHAVDMQFGNQDLAAEPESLALVTESDDGSMAPVVVLHNASSVGLHQGRGLSILRWIPDEIVPELELSESETFFTTDPERVAQAHRHQRLASDSAMASTGLHLLLEEVGDEGSTPRVIHLQGWSGGDLDVISWDGASWLPYQVSAITAAEIEHEGESVSRLGIVSADRISTLHGRYLDPAGIGNDPDVRYLAPSISPDGTILTYFLHDPEAGELSLWHMPWGDEAEEITYWEIDAEPRFIPPLTTEWLRHDTLVVTAPTDWHRGLPQEAEIMRITFGDGEAMSVETVRTFRAGGRDTGIAVHAWARSPKNDHVGLRIRHYRDRNPDGEYIDAIMSAPASDLSQTVQILRSSGGDGLHWHHSGDWIIVATDAGLLAVDHTGTRRYVLTSEDVNHPVIIGEDEIWYQDPSENGRIMRIRYALPISTPVDDVDKH